MEELVFLDINHLTYWDWFGLALICLVLELIISGVYFFWVASAAVVVGLLLVMFPELDWKIQLMVFSVDAIGSIFVWKYFFSKKGAQPGIILNQRDQKYVGMIITLESPIEHGQGFVTLDDTRWKVEGEDQSAGQRVKIVSVQNQVLHVKALD